ncbi:MAG: cation:proton antiporter [Pseudomonadota bacterium]
MHAMAQLALIWAAVFVAVIAARKTRLTPVLYYLAMGSLLVNIGWLPVTPDHFIEGLAEIGIIVIMFALGFEEDNANFMASIRKSWGIAFFGALVPFLVAFGTARWYWPDNLNLALMVGLTMTATAVSLTMVSLRSEGLGSSPAATRIMTSAVIDDIASLALVAIMVPIATGEAQLGAQGILLIMGKAVLFFIIVSILGVWVFPHSPQGWVSRVPLLGTLGVRNLLAFSHGEFATLAVLLLALVIGLLAHALGFHPAVGAYLAGLVLREEYFHRDDERDSFIETRGIVDNVAFTWLGPVFFVLLGSKLVLDWDIVVSVLPQTAVLLVGISVGQVLSASVAARYTGGMDWAGSVMVGFGMLGRAELAFVVMNIAYVQNQILDTEAFYMLMLTIFWLNLMVPLTIRFWKPRYEKSLAATG